VCPTDDTEANVREAGGYVMAITLSQRTALVTGSSRGIGRGVALKLAEAGVKRIAVNYVENDAAARETARLLKERGAEVLLLKANVGDVDQLKAMFSKVKEAWDSLDIYVSNARASVATGFYASPMEISLEQWHATLDTQATEFLVACREAVPIMGKNGRIFAITYAPGSIKGSWQPWVAMGSAKAAKESLVRYFAVALGQRGITVNSISPGACDDSVLSGLPPDVFKTIKEWHESGWTPMRRLGLPADIGNAVVLLCTEQAAFITGQTLYVDGGASAMMADFPLPIQGIK
jgi:enoyl-[acyl-carrier protein] reductase III